LVLYAKNVEKTIVIATEIVKQDISGNSGIAVAFIVTEFACPEYLIS
jgi:hypothetical protein